MESISAVLFIENTKLIKAIIQEYHKKKICVMGKRLEHITLDKDYCFHVNFNQGKIFSIYYKDENLNIYSPIYYHYNKKKAQILTSKT